MSWCSQRGQGWCREHRFSSRCGATSLANTDVESVIRELGIAQTKAKLESWRDVIRVKVTITALGQSWHRIKHHSPIIDIQSFAISDLRRRVATRVHNIRGIIRPIHRNRIWQPGTRIDSTE